MSQSVGGNEGVSESISGGGNEGTSESISGRE